MENVKTVPNHLTYSRRTPKTSGHQGHTRATNIEMLPVNLAMLMPVLPPNMGSTSKTRVTVTNRVTIETREVTNVTRNKAHQGGHMYGCQITGLH